MARRPTKSGISILVMTVVLVAMAKCARVEADLVWHLNDSFSLQASNFTGQQKLAWPLNEYPGSLAFLIAQGASYDVSTYLCFLASPSPNSVNTSLPSSPSVNSSSFSFTLSIYICLTDVIYRGAIVWTANRARPILGTTLSLTLRSDGNLVLLGSDPSSPVWSSNTSNRGVATMELSQNPVSLILYSSNRSIVWQSADHPTDTLTMTQFLLPNNRLVSWASSTDPANGSYSLVMEAGGLALYASLPMPQPYWIWSFYGFNDSFSILHTCEPSPLAAFMDPEGALQIGTFDYPGKGPNSTPDNASHWPPFCSLHPDYTTAGTLEFTQYATAVSVSVSNATFLRLDFDGNLRAYTLGSTWSTPLDLFGSDACFLPSSCGPYSVCTPGPQCACPANNQSIFTPLNSSSLSLGCPPVNGLICPGNSTSGSNQMQQIMLPLSGLDYFSNKYTRSLNLSTQQDCVNECFQNCSCLGAFWHVDKQGCYHLDQIRSLQGALNVSNYLAFLKVVIQQRASNSTRVIAGIVSGILAFLILSVFVVFLRRRKRFTDAETDEEDDTIAIPGLPTRFSYKDLQSITNNFETKLGKGAFGVVCVGVLPSGDKVAVKQLEGMSQGDEDFKSEVAIMGGIHHNNLLSLIGYCAQKKHRLLLSEYMENGSLDQWLFGEPHKKSLLTWKARCKIALGTARGLAYLHEDCRERILHLDIKPQNILLDSNFDARVADFGLSRLVDRNKPHVVSTVRGTPGYLAPEWLKEGEIDDKCDVFSFGMLLMEIISGRKNFDESRNEIYYPDWAFWQVERGDLRNLSDAKLETEEDMVQMKRMINTSFLCVLEDPALRPSMSEVVQMLQGQVPVDEIDLSTLHQGLLFVLRSPSSFAKATIEKTMQDLLFGAVSDSTPLLNREGGGVMSFEISGR